MGEKWQIEGPLLLWFRWGNKKLFLQEMLLLKFQVAVILSNPTLKWAKKKEREREEAGREEGRRWGSKGKKKKLMLVFLPRNRSASWCLRRALQPITVFPYYTKRALLSHIKQLPQLAPCSNQRLDGASVQSLMLQDTCSPEGVFPTFDQGTGAIPPPGTPKRISAFIVSGVTPKTPTFKCVCNISLNCKMWMP